MEWFEKRLNFENTLNAAKAAAFSDHLERRLRGLSGLASEASAEPDTQAAGPRGPEMILAESGEAVGRQIDEYDLPDPQTSEEDGTEEREAAEVDGLAVGSMNRRSSRPDDEEIEAAAPRALGSELATKRRLAFAEIEKLAETIKEKLEWDLKVHRERRGEKPE